LEKTIIYETKLLNRIIQSYANSRIQQMFIVHNFRNVDNLEKIEDAIESNVIGAFFSNDKNIQKQEDLYHVQILKNNYSSKTIIHHYLGSNHNSSCQKLNKRTIQNIQSRIKFSPFPNKADKKR